MKSFFLIPVLLLAGCASQRGADPFMAFDTGTVETVLVGEWVDETRSLDGPDESRFETYFEVSDPLTVKRLCLLARTTERGHGYPFIGILSCQRFLTAGGKVVADTRIVNFDNAVVIHEPDIPVDGYWETMRSPEFCRTIYDLMLTHCPEKIEEQREMYRKVDRQLETLLFDGRDSEEPAQRGSSPVVH